MPFALKGVAEMKGKMLQAAKRQRENAKESLQAHAEEILEDAQENYVPVDEGNLRDSGAVTVSDGLRVTIGFGDAATAAYAAAVHEHPSDFDPPSWRQADHVNFKPEGHGPKFLEIPFMAAVGTLPQSLASDLHVEHLLE